MGLSNLSKTHVARNWQNQDWNPALCDENVHARNHCATTVTGGGSHISISSGTAP